MAAALRWLGRSALRWEDLAIVPLRARARVDSDPPRSPRDARVPSEPSRRLTRSAARREPRTAGGQKMGRLARHRGADAREGSVSATEEGHPSRLPPLRSRRDASDRRGAGDRRCEPRHRAPFPDENASVGGRPKRHRRFTARPWRVMRIIRVHRRLRHTLVGGAFRDDSARTHRTGVPLKSRTTGGAALPSGSPSHWRGPGIWKPQQGARRGSASRGLTRAAVRAGPNPYFDRLVNFRDFFVRRRCSSDSVAFISPRGFARSPAVLGADADPDGEISSSRSLSPHYWSAVALPTAC